ncbi:hypothetical protein DPMN_139090 [Dreissena polymorpha]|uniref:Uncharacterized protein n=1 Tax=Dreissena polymorpha TaxID=45954 RepID=A0A9D4JHU8_DREPO|nr:hypothetical protein DPMN_139090 [Dreissena polymorpha]
MATVRQYDGDNAIERWRHCDDTTATVRYDYRIVAPRHADDINALPEVFVGEVSLLPELLKESRAMNTSEAYKRGCKSHPRQTSIVMENRCL